MAQTLPPGTYEAVTYNVIVTISDQGILTVDHEFTVLDADYDLHRFEYQQQYPLSPATITSGDTAPLATTQLTTNESE